LTCTSLLHVKHSKITNSINIFYAYLNFFTNTMIIIPHTTINITDRPPTDLTSSDILNALKSSLSGEIFEIKLSKTYNRCECKCQSMVSKWQNQHEITTLFQHFVYFVSELLLSG